MSYVNDQFFELTGHSWKSLDNFDWLDLVADEDMGKVKDDWARMLAGKKVDELQFRLKKTWVNQDGIVSNIWVQSSNHPQVDKSGKVISELNTPSIDLQRLICLGILGTLFDISVCTRILPVRLPS